MFLLLLFVATGAGAEALFFGATTAAAFTTGAGLATGAAATATGLGAGLANIGLATGAGAGAGAAFFATTGFFSA